MDRLKEYVLLFCEESEDLQALESLLCRLSCPVAIANSEDQAMAKASQDLPFLVILTDTRRDHAPGFVRQLRRQPTVCGPTIVLLTEPHAPWWLPQEDNPGFDGYLVKPLAVDVLISLIESAWARQSYCETQLIR